MSISTSSVLGTAQKGGRTVSIILDSSSSGNSLFVYDSTAVYTNGYLARIDPDGSYSPLGGGSINATNANIPTFTVPALGNFTWWAGTTLICTLGNTGNMHIAGSLTQNSSLALKKNVKFINSAAALQIVLDTHLIRFDWKTERDSSVGRPRYASWAAEHTPPELSGPKQDSFDAMAGVAYAMAAIQELHRRIFVLEEEVARLKQIVPNAC